LGYPSGMRSSELVFIGCFLEFSREVWKELGGYIIKSLSCRLLTL